MTVGKLRQEVIELQKEVEDRISNFYGSGYGLGDMTFINNALKRITKDSNFIELEHKPKLMDGDPVGTIEKMIEKVKEQD